jgi:hypothetical protein
MKLNDHETKVLEFLSEDGDYYFHPFANIMDDTGLDRKQVRRACRSLAKKGLTEFKKGLWSEDGEPGGSGYGATKEGRAVLNIHKRGESDG